MVNSELRLSLYADKKLDLGDLIDFKVDFDGISYDIEGTVDCVVGIKDLSNSYICYELVNNQVVERVLDEQSIFSISRGNTENKNYWMRVNPGPNFKLYPLRNYPLN